MKPKTKRKIRKFINKYLGLQIYRVDNASIEAKKPKVKMQYVHDPVDSYMIKQDYQNMLIDELSSIAEGFLTKNHYSDRSKQKTKNIIEDFFNLYRNRQMTENTHGSGFHNAFWLYYIARTLNPELIVESGVWKGHTTWLLSQACPSATIHGFDLSFTYLEYKNLKNVHYHKQDWESFKFSNFDKERAMIFFDCHFNHAQRLIEAQDKGFKHIIFDDNPPAHKIYGFSPGIPTAAMLHSGIGLDSTEISWVKKGEEFSKPIDIEQANQARKLIKIHHLLPDVASKTRFGGYDFLSYVQI